MKEIPIIIREDPIPPKPPTEEPPINPPPINPLPRQPTINPQPIRPPINPKSIRPPINLQPNPPIINPPANPRIISVYIKKLPLERNREIEEKHISDYFIYCLNIQPEEIKIDSNTRLATIKIKESDSRKIPTEEIYILQCNILITKSKPRKKKPAPGINTSNPPNKKRYILSGFPPTVNLEDIMVAFKSKEDPIELRDLKRLPDNTIEADMTEVDYLKLKGSEMKWGIHPIKGEIKGKKKK